MEFYEPPAYDPGKPTAAVLLSNKGTESTDLLAPYEILASSGALNVYTVAPERKVSPVWQGVDILPHFSFDELQQKLERSPDIIFIPNVIDPQNTAIVHWVQQNAKDSTLIVSVCEGVRVLAAADLLDNRKASSHFLALGQLEEDFPKTEWVQGVRYVEDGNIITSAGVTASIDATLHLLHRVAGVEVAQETAQRLHYRMELHPRKVDVFDFKLSDFVSLFMTAGYLWNKTKSGVLIYDGMRETDLASVLDLYPRVFDREITTIAHVRKPFQSRNGLNLIPWAGFTSLSGLDELIIPGDVSVNELASSSQKWIADQDVELKRPHVIENKTITTAISRFAYDRVVQDISTQSSNAAARAVAKWVEYPVKHLQFSGPAWPFSLLFIPLAVGITGVFICLWLEKRIVRSRNTRPSLKRTARV